jgi:hypothetical protein
MNDLLHHGLHLDARSASSEASETELPIGTINIRTWVCYRAVSRSVGGDARDEAQ